MADPPLAAGAVQDTTDWALALDVAATAVGAPGDPATKEFEAAEAAPVPAELSAATVKLYAVPEVRPGTVQAVVPVVQVKPPGLDVTE